MSSKIYNNWIIDSCGILVLSFEQRFIEGKMQDTSCAFYKIQQSLAKNPEALSEDEVNFVDLFLRLLAGFCN